MKAMTVSIPMRLHRRLERHPLTLAIVLALRAMRGEVR